MAAIYGLISNRDNEILYIGQTYRDIGARFHEHYWNVKGLSTPLYAKIKEERRLGFDIYHEILEYCSPDSLNQREEYWIGGLPGLVNQRSSRLKGWICLSNQERTKVEAIRRSKRGGIPNWYGHRGVTYYPGLDAWQVAIQHWGNLYVLPGDGGPRSMGWMTFTAAFGRERHTGDWYFSDGIDAVVARDRERKRLNARQSKYWPEYVWPPDLETPEGDAAQIEDGHAHQGSCPLLTSEADQFLSTAAERVIVELGAHEFVAHERLLFGE